MGKDDFLESRKEKKNYSCACENNLFLLNIRSLMLAVTASMLLLSDDLWRQIPVCHNDHIHEIEYLLDSLHPSDTLCHSLQYLLNYQSFYQSYRQKLVSCDNRRKKKHK